MNSQHLTGSIHELKAASYFASLGYSVYWPLLTQSRCDFVIELEGVFQKVQVKTATQSYAGNFNYLQCRLKTRNKFGKVYKDGDFDIIVFIYEEKMWLALWEEVKGLVSVCLGSDNPEYKPRADKTYDPIKWRIH